MNILLSNDDGIDAEGIRVLEGIVKKMGHNVFIVAPDRNQSATSHSLTLTQPLRIHSHSQNQWSTTGTPTDCVLIATHGLISDQLDMVISGINHGPNMGEDIFYSGTVAAAMEGHLMNIPSLAVSLAAFSNRDFNPSKQILPHIINYVGNADRKGIFLNINIPNVPFERINGLKITELGSRIYSDTLIEKTDPRGRKYYWIGGKEPAFKRKKGSDFEAVQNDYVSVTPLQINLTDRKTAQCIRDMEDVL